MDGNKADESTLFQDSPTNSYHREKSQPSIHDPRRNVGGGNVSTQHNRFIQIAVSTRDIEERDQIMNMFTEW